MQQLNSGYQPQQVGSPKFALSRPQPGFDKTLPTAPTLKHYASNPNISLQMNANKTNQYHTPTYPKKDFGMPNQRPHLNQGRSGRNTLAQSLIMGSSESTEAPEQPSSKKQTLLGKLGGRRAYRMSETIDDAPPPMFAQKQETQQANKDVNFMKNKIGGEEKRDLLINRQKPAFLNRVNSGDMKRSLCVDPSMQPAPSFPMPKRPRKVKVEDFQKIKELGAGKYGRVYLVAQKSTGFVCALKVIQKKLLHQEEITDQFIREVKIQMFLNHPNIVKMYGCFHDATNIYIILEVGTGGQLYHQLKKAQPLPEPRIAFIMKQVCEAVNQIHSLRIIHRDIKPQNIVLHDNIIKLCDFGWSVHQDNKLRTTFCGTPLYVCPQILKGREYDEKIDIWSIGIMMYEMVVGENPFKITREEELIKIVKDEIKIPSYLFVSSEVRDFLDRCLRKNPDDRANIKELVNHPFFKKHADKQKSKITV